MKKHWMEMVFILPAVATAIAAAEGVRMNTPVFAPIIYPAQEQAGESDESSAADRKMEGQKQAAAGDKNPTKDKNSARDKSSVGKKLKKAGYTKSNTWKDGVYTGSGEGFGGIIQVRVTILDGKITDIQVISGAGETPSYLEQAKGVIPGMIAAQSPEVDMVSGATYSSNGIRSAVIQALNKAGAQLPVEAKKLPEKTSDAAKTEKQSLPEPEKQPSGTLKDGVYTVSAACEPDGRKAFAAYLLTADVKFQDGKCTSINHFSSTDESNRNFYLKAADGTDGVNGVVSQILKKQSASGINAVSGATCSSKTIQRLYLNALQKATGEKQKAPAVVQKPKQKKTSSDSSKKPDISIPSVPDVTESDTLKDGTYHVSTTVAADEWEEFEDYGLTGDVTFFGGKLTEITNLVPDDPTNQRYCDLAANGYGTKKGVIQQLMEKQNSEVDAVSGATCSSRAILQLYLEALRQAAGKETADGGESGVQIPVISPSAIQMQQRNSSKTGTGV